MGIFGALTTAVSGMRAQSFALENISGNIANATTIAFKRIDTSFQDLIPDNLPWRQLSGSVVAYSRATNNVQGDIQSASVGTFMAINGNGFFAVQKPTGLSDNRPVFGGAENYTRRGDFQPDQNGYLVNGAGYYLMGIPIDPTTGNLTGSVPQLLQFQADFLPAERTTSIEYRANLSTYPLTPNADKDVPRSELINLSNFSANPLAVPAGPAKIIGSGAALSADAVAVTTGTTDLSALASTGGDIEINGTLITFSAGDDMNDVVAAINLETVNTGVTASLDANDRLVLTGGNADTQVAVGAASTAVVLTELGLNAGTVSPTNLLTQNAVGQGQTLSVTIGGNPATTITFGTGVGEVSTLAELNAALAAVAGGTATVDVATGNINIDATNLTDTITLGGTVTHSNFGIRTLTGLPSNGTVVADDVDAFLDCSVGGGAVTCYDASGAPVNLQLRWVKTDSSAYGGVDTWNLFYQTDSNADGTEAAWVNAGVNYTFSADGKMSPPISDITLNDVVVDGVSLGDIEITHGTDGLTQFADPNGNVQVNRMQQNGFAAGELQNIAVSDRGRIVGSYSNGRTLDLAEITLVDFAGANFLKRIDGGAFEVTDGSGPPVYGAGGTIVGAALEGSNTDIADEFTKLIVTQEAYSANTRVITTTNDMVRELLDMVR